MRKLPTAKIGSVITSAASGFASGAKDPNGIAQVRMNNVETDGSWNWKTIRRVPSDKVREQYYLAPGDVLFNATNSPTLVGKSAYFDGFEEPLVFSNHFLRLRADAARLDGRYLTRWLNVLWRSRLFETRCTQWVNQATYRKEELLSLEIPLPCLPEQKRIAAILDKADALRAKRRESLAQLDTLLQTTFLDMFGDPVTNPMGWSTSPIGELGEVITGNTPSRKNPEYYGDAIEWIKSDNINDPSFTLTKADERLSESGRSVARIAPEGSILITCIAGSPSCIGNAGIADRDVAFNQQINAFVPSKHIDMWFAFSFFLVGKRLVQKASTNSMKGMVSKSAFSGIEVPLPPLDLQRRFAAIVESVERQKVRLRAHLAELDTLFASLQSRAFNGEL